MLHRVALSLGVALLVAASASQARAQSPYFDALIPYSGFSYGGSLYNSGHIPVPPYFALHPPVYYSPPITRMYGQSPFACGCHDHFSAAQPQVRVIPNIHLRAPAEKKERELDRVKTAAAPLLIINPYVVDGVESKSDAQLAANSE